MITQNAPLDVFYSKVSAKLGQPINQVQIVFALEGSTKQPLRDENDYKLAMRTGYSKLNRRLHVWCTSI